MTPESTPDQLPDVPVLDALQHEVALFARRAEQTRLGGLGAARDSMDRAAYLLLSRLDQDGPAGVKALAARLGIDSSTVTRQVAPLVEAGLVRRTADPADGRAVVLDLSPLGADRLAEVRVSRRRLIAVLTADWTGEERTAFCALLTRFNASVTRLQAAGAEAGQPAGTGTTGTETGTGTGTETGRSAGLRPEPG